MTGFRGTVYISNMVATILTVLLFIGVTSSNPIGPAANGAEQDEQEPIAQDLMGRYYANPYEVEDMRLAKRNEFLAQMAHDHDVAHKRIPRYYEKRNNYPGSYWELLKALEEEAALEAPAQEEARGDDESPATGVEAPVSDGHQIDKRRRRRYGFWVTAINKMDNGHLRGFLQNHKNIRLAVMVNAKHTTKLNIYVAKYK